jgi:hypothetical protein
MLPMLLLLTVSAPYPARADSEPGATSVLPAIEPLAQVQQTVTANSSGLDYSYIEAGYIWTDSHQADENLGGLELVGSVQFAPHWFARVAYDHQSNDADLDRFFVGAGYHTPLDEKLDLYGLFSIVHDEISDTGNDFSDTGYAAEIGLRVLVTPTFEVNGAAEWVDVHDSDPGLKCGVRHDFTNSLSIVARAEFVANDETFAAGLRLAF